MSQENNLQETMAAKLSFVFDSTSNIIKFKSFIQSFRIYLLANNIDKESDLRKVAILLNSLGTKGIEIFNSFNVVMNEKIILDDVIQKFFNYFEPKKNLTMSRYEFFIRKQGENETFGDFITSLENLSLNCEFKELRKGLVRDMFIANLHGNNSQVRRVLLQEAELTLERAVEISKTMILAQQNSEIIDRAGEVPRVNENVLKIDNKCQQRGSRRPNREVSSQCSEFNSSQARFDNRRESSRGKNINKSPARYSCRRCGKSHAYGMCPAFYSICSTCKKRGHYYRFCFYNGNNKKYVKRMSTNENSELGDNRDNNYINNYSVSSLGCEETSKGWNLSININNVNINCILDTGAEVNVMSYSIFKKLKLSDNSISTRADINIFAFGGHKIPIIGQAEILCKFGVFYEKICFIITKNECKTVIGLPTCQKYGIIKRVFTLDNKTTCMHIVNEYSDLFQGLGCLPTVCRLKLNEGAVPRVDPPRRVPFSLMNSLRDELKNMEKLQVIEKVSKPTSWVSSIVITKKNNGQLRICLDPRNLNKCIMREHFPLQNIDDIRSKLKGSAYFSHLDAFSGFWALKLDDESSDLCTFQTPFGRYKYLRLPFGINAATEIFYRVMLELFSDLEGIHIFIDDILVYGETVEIHNSRLRKFLDRAREVNLKLNMKKCKFLVEEVCFLGFIFSKEGVQVDPEKVKAIKEMPTPQNIKDLQRFLGMVNFMAPFIENLSESTNILRKLLKKDSVWLWDSNCDKCYSDLKNLITNAPVLIHYDPKLKLTLSVDSSKEAVGAVIMQNSRPIAYSSRTLTKSQQNYAQIEKELFAIQFGCNKFHQYVYGNRVRVETDHKPLVYLFEKPLHDVPARLQRMMLSLQRYNLEVFYVPGKQMYISDTLSRAALKENYIPEYEKDMQYHVNSIFKGLAVSEQYLNKLTAATNNDENLQLLKKYYLNGWPSSKNQVHSMLKCFWNFQNEIHVINNLIFKGTKLIVPQSMRSEMLVKIHEGHQGMNKCLNLARETLYWPNMSVDIKNIVEQCSICAKFMSNNVKEPLKSFPINKHPWQQVGIDLLYFDSKNYLVVTDYYSKYIEVAMLNKDYTADSVIINLKSIFARHGIPISLVSDGGPPFMSVKFKNFLYDWDIEHKVTSPYYAQSNGQAEISVKIIKNILKKSKESNTDPYIALLHYRNTPKNDFPSPAQLLMSRNLRVNLPVSHQKLRPKVVTFKDYKNSFDKNNMKTSRYYNRNKKVLSSFKKGDLVYFKKNPNSYWLPATIKDIHNFSRSYIVEDSHGVLYRRNRYHLRPRYNKHNGVVKNFNSTTLDNECNMRYGFGTTYDNVNYERSSSDSDTQMRGDCVQATDRQLGEQQGENNNNILNNRNNNYVTRHGRIVRPNKFYIQEC